MESRNIQTAERANVPFLPVNSELSATRNQARQKLGRLNNLEFTTLLVDILSEAKRRQLGSIPSTSRGHLFIEFLKKKNQSINLKWNEMQEVGRIKSLASPIRSMSPTMNLSTIVCPWRKSRSMLNSLYWFGFYEFFFFFFF